MKVYVFGNQDLSADKAAIEIAHKLANELSFIDFIYLKPNEDIPTEKDLLIMDVVKGIKKVTILNESHIEKLVNAPRYSAHDFDLGFQLKYLKKLGKISTISLLGIPQDNSVDYTDEVRNSLKKIYN